MGSSRLAAVDDPRLTPAQKHPWMDGALCAQVGIDPFFPKKGGSSIDAKAICLGCDVKIKCLAFAMNTEEHEVDRHGIFGGLSERERKRLARMLQEDPSMTLEQGRRAIMDTWRTKGKKRKKLAA